MTEEHLKFYNKIIQSVKTEEMLHRVVVSLRNEAGCHIYNHHLTDFECKQIGIKKSDLLSEILALYKKIILEKEKTP